MTVDVYVVAFCFLILLPVSTLWAANAGAGSITGGAIGEPDHEVIVEPAEEPVPKVAPAPPLAPVPVPEPAAPL
jgi:hypothetical protein